MLPWGPQDIKFSLGTPKSHIGKTWNFAKLKHCPSNSYHRAIVSWHWFVDYVLQGSIKKLVESLVMDNGNDK